MKITNIDEKIGDVVSKFDEIELAYLFGSFADASFSILSDLDIGIYCNRKIRDPELGKFKLRLINDLILNLHFNEIDLVIMDFAPITLNFEIIKKNHLLLVRNHDLKIDFEHYIISRYLDRRYYEIRSDNIFIKRIKQHGLFFKREE
ncbi:MAG: type VII toxin-antitoxin system MntA family adenylyltransferase antitoxin [Promethearchaeota archaeon]